MQRCPYIHEMRERLLGENNRESVPLEQMERANLIDNRQSATSDSHQVGTVVKLHADGYHTSPAHQRTPLVPRDLGEDFNLDLDDDFPLDPRKPKNANDYQNNSASDNKTHLNEDKLKLYSANKNFRESRLAAIAEGTSLFIVTSLVYAMILIVVCIAYVISDVTTHRLPILYFEGFFTYLYGASILFLLYVFCFLLQESSCCNGGSKPKPPPKEKKQKSKKSKKSEQEEGKEGGKGSVKGAKGEKLSPFQEKFPKKKRDLVREQYMLISQDSQAEAEAAQATPKNIRKRKTTHGDPTHGSFFLRVGAIAFGLGAMIYVGLEFGSFFEIPFTSPCHHILSGVNPLLQMIFTFMQMYFIFMNARLNIHRFKVVARFGLMHVVATNICVWIRTLVKESLYEITLYHQREGAENSAIAESMRRHNRAHAGIVLKTHSRPDSEYEIIGDSKHLSKDSSNFAKMIVDPISNVFSNNYEATTRRYNIPSSTDATTMINKIKKFITSTTSTSTTTTTTTTEAPTSIFSSSTGEDFATMPPSNPPSSFASFFTSTFGNAAPEATAAAISSTTEENSVLNNFFSGLENSYQTNSELSHDLMNSYEQYENFDSIYPAALSSNIGVINSTACGRIDIMGTIVYDSAPYLYPFIIEYSLIGAVVLYVMWKHIGRYPRYLNQEDLEHRLEVMLSRRAVAMAQQARSGRVDCVGSSKGLFFGLLLLVGALICLILFFVLVRHSKFSLLAIYLADASHCILMIFTILAIIIGFIRVKNLKFRCEEQSNLNDILLRISAFGLFVYSVFSVIAGSLKMFESEPNLLVMITGITAVLQVVLQILFIADVSRRRVHLPEHDRSKPGRQIVTFLLICNVAMFAVYTFEAQKVFSNPVQLDFYGFVPWSIIQRITLPLCIFHRFHSAVTLAEIWKTTYKARLE